MFNTLDDVMESDDIAININLNPVFIRNLYILKTL